MFVEDDMTVHQSRFRLNEDFSLFYDMNSLIDEDELIENPHDTRIVWQRRLFRKGATFALMENKLLCHSLLLSYGIPKAEIYYGAFASKAMGEWPEYDRNDFISTLKTIPQVTEDHLFVMKPATGQNSEGTIVMNHKKWIEEGWSFERLADQVEAYFSITASYWGQQYEHLGVVVQQSVLSQDNVVEFHAGSFENISSLVFEFEPHVVFGTLCGGELHLVPHNEDYHLKINYCHGDARLQDVSGVDPSVWEIIQPKLLQSPGRLAKTAKRIAHAFGADWFRLDVFIDLNGMFYVNEVTYPSGMHPSEDCTYPLYYHMYKHTTLDILEPRSVLEPLLRRINVSYDVFIESTDYKHMTDLTEEEWDDYILSMPHQFEEDVFWSETEEDEEEEEEDEDDEWEDEW